MTKQRETVLFAVGSPDNLRSCVWRLWAHNNDVYVAARDLVRTMKISLHKSSTYRLSYTEESGVVSATGDRAELKWNPVVFTSGWQMGLHIVVPANRFMRPFTSQEIPPPQIQWFDPPAKGRKLTFTVLISTLGTKSDLDRVVMPGDRLVGHVSKSNGDVVWVVLRDEGMSEDELSEVNRLSEVQVHPAAGDDEGSVTNARILSVYSDPSGSRLPTIFDIGLGKESIVQSSAI